MVRELYSMRCELVGAADAGQHENLRRIDRAGREDDLPIGAGVKAFAVAPIFHRHGAAALDDNSLSQGVRGDDKIRPPKNRAQESFRGAAPLAVPDRKIIAAEAFLLLAIEIVIDGVARLPAGFDEQVEERILAARAANGQRPPGAMKGVAALDMAFRLAKVWEDFRIAPAGKAELRPAIVIAAIAAHIDHAIDRRGAAQRLAARPIDLPAVEF